MKKTLLLLATLAPLALATCTGYCNNYPPQGHFCLDDSWCVLSPDVVACNEDPVYANCTTNFCDEGEACPFGYTCGGTKCAADVLGSCNCTLIAPVPGVCTCCGNGNLDEGEECDDTNFDDGDGCSSDCTCEVPEVSSVTFWTDEVGICDLGEVITLRSSFGIAVNWTSAIGVKCYNTDNEFDGTCTNTSCECTIVVSLADLATSNAEFITFAMEFYVISLTCPENEAVITSGSISVPFAPCGCSEANPCMDDSTDYIWTIVSVSVIGGCFCLLLVYGIWLNRRGFGSEYERPSRRSSR